MEQARGLRSAVGPWARDHRPTPAPPTPAVVKNKRRIEEIKEEIDGKRAGRGKGSSEQQAVKNKLAELRGQFQALVVRGRAQCPAAAGCLPPPLPPLPAICDRTFAGCCTLLRAAAHIVLTSCVQASCSPPQRKPQLMQLAAAAPPPSAPSPLPSCPQSQKNQLRSQLEMASKARESARSSMKELRSSMKFTKGAPPNAGAGGGRVAPAGRPLHSLQALAGGAACAATV